MSGSIFIEVKSLAGSNFIVATGIIAVQQMDVAKCNIMLAGGVTIPCNEAARDIAARIDAALKPKEEASHGHAVP
jgi:hypothetical protein